MATDSNSQKFLQDTGNRIVAGLALALMIAIAVAIIMVLSDSPEGVPSAPGPVGGPNSSSPSPSTL